MRAAEMGVNLFDMGYGDEVHIPDELKGASNERHFSLKVGAPKAEDLEAIVDKHLANVKREAIDILRVHHYAFMADDALRRRIEDLKGMRKIRALCTIRHFEADQQAYLDRGSEPEADADLVIYRGPPKQQRTDLEIRESDRGALEASPRRRNNSISPETLAGCRTCLIRSSWIVFRSTHRRRCGIAASTSRLSSLHPLWASTKFCPASS